MSKPDRQRASGVACIIDGVVAKRVQTLGSNIELNREATEELANTGVVQYISDSPNVTIQIDTNDVGSTDTLCLLTDKMINYTAANFAAGPRVGNYAHAIRTTTSNSASRIITEQDMLNGYCSILATFNQEGTQAARTVWHNHCALTAANLSYDVNGNAAENYTLAADNKTWFLNSWGDTHCYKPHFFQLRATAAVAASHGFLCTALTSCLPNGAKIVALGVNNNIWRSTAGGGYGVTGNATFTDVEAGGFLATSVAFDYPMFSTSPSSTDRVWVLWTDGTANSWESSSSATRPGWELEASAGAIGGLRRGNIKCYLWNTGVSSKGTYTAAGKALRLQTVGIDVALGEDKLYELGTDGFYAISKQSPVPVTINVTALDSDLEYFAMLTSTGIASANVRTLNAADFNGNNSLRIEVYYDKAQTQLLKTISITKMYVQTENLNITVGENATHEMSFTADNITIQGNPNGTAPNVTGGWL